MVHTGLAKAKWPLLLQLDAANPNLPLRRSVTPRPAPFSAARRPVRSCDLHIWYPVQRTEYGGDSDIITMPRIDVASST